MRTTGNPVFPEVPMLTGNPEKDVYILRVYCLEMQKSLVQAMFDIYHDLSKGKARHQVFSAAPTTDDIDEGEIALLDAATDKLYTRIGDTIRSVNLA